MEVFMKKLVSVLRFLVIPMWLCLVFLNRCSFKLPSDAPTWDVNFIIPLISRMYTVEELVEDSDELVVDQLNEQIIFTMEEDIDRFEVGQHLKVGAAGGSATVDVPLGIAVGWERTQNAEVALPEEVVVESATIESGEILIEIENTSGYTGRVEIEIPGITLEGNTIKIEVTSTPGSNLSFPVNLHAYTISPRILWGRSHVDFTVYLRVLSVQNGQSGYVRGRLSISEIVFQRVTGILNEVDLPFESTEMEIEFPEELEGFMVGSAELELLLWFGVQVPMRFRLTIEGFETRGVPSPPILVDTWVTPNTQGFTSLLVPDVTDMINSQPSRILITGSIEVGNGTTRATVYDTSSVAGSFLFRAPLIVALPQHTSTAEPDTLEIEEDTREAVRDNLMELAIVADIENHVPISGNVSLYFSKTRGDETLYDQPDLIIGPVSFSPATLTNGDPKVVATPGASQWNQTMTKAEDIVLFEEEELYMGIKFNFNGTQGELAKIRPLDYIRIQAHGAAKVHTKIPEEDDGEGGGS